MSSAIRRRRAGSGGGGGGGSGMLGVSMFRGGMPMSAKAQAIPATIWDIFLLVPHSVSGKPNETSWEKKPAGSLQGTWASVCTQMKARQYSTSVAVPRGGGPAKLYKPGMVCPAQVEYVSKYLTETYLLGTHAYLLGTDGAETELQQDEDGTLAGIPEGDAVIVLRNGDAEEVVQVAADDTLAGSEGALGAFTMFRGAVSGRKSRLASGVFEWE